MRENRYKSTQKQVEVEISKIIMRIWMNHHKNILHYLFRPYNKTSWPLGPPSWSLYSPTLSICPPQKDRQSTSSRILGGRRSEDRLRLPLGSFSCEFVAFRRYRRWWSRTSARCCSLSWQMFGNTSYRS